MEVPSTYRKWLTDVSGAQRPASTAGTHSQQTVRSWAPRAYSRDGTVASSAQSTEGQAGCRTIFSKHDLNTQGVKYLWEIGGTRYDYRLLNFTRQCMKAVLQRLHYHVLETSHPGQLNVTASALRSIMYIYTSAQINVQNHCKIKSVTKPEMITGRSLRIQ